MLHDSVKNGLTLAAIIFAIATLFFSTPTSASSATGEVATQAPQASQQNLAVK